MCKYYRLIHLGTLTISAIQACNFAETMASWYVT